MMHDGPSLPVTHHYYHGQLSSVHLVTATPLIFRFPDESKCNSPLRVRLSTQAGLVACGQAVLAKLTCAYDHGSHTPSPHIHHAHTCRRDLDLVTTNFLLHIARWLHVRRLSGQAWAEHPFACFDFLAKM